MTPTTDKRIRWAILWVSNGHSPSRHLINMNCDVALFKTRAEEREFNEKQFGYIKKRPDLKGNPHWWTYPRVVRVQVEYRWNEPK